ncbi:hypothetical protein [Rufibacter tibetensis]|uniref:Uncharacterized protein n=1 Tax=Rufibacter tibetensis TaxID=512763 RepID=A0A0P0CIG1_9BACT|nr:hypothetical protein [Rufibacter tibetensis]ALI99156.1 hypothetical protein DC20_09430 [Rufibacter tibetensis]
MERKPEPKPMKRFEEMIRQEQSVCVNNAIYWCDSRIRFYPEDQWLQWCRNRFDEDFLYKVEGLYLEGYYSRSFEYSFEEFVDCVAEVCRVYYYDNGGEMTLAEKRFEQKMQDESGYLFASYKENPDLSPDKIQLELEDGVAYISKKSGWVLSQF